MRHCRQLRHTDSVSLYDSEGCEEDEVGGGLLALDLQGDEEPDGEDEGREQNPGIALHSSKCKTFPVFDSSNKRIQMYESRCCILVDILLCLVFLSASAIISQSFP